VPGTSVRGKKERGGDFDRRRPTVGKKVGSEEGACATKVEYGIGIAIRHGEEKMEAEEWER